MAAHDARAELDEQLDDDTLNLIARLATASPDELELQMLLAEGDEDSAATGIDATQIYE